MNDTPLQLTLREIRTHAADPRGWVVLAVISLVVGAVGPFGTFAAMNLPARLAYWVAVVAGTYAVGFVCSTLLEALIGDRLPRLLRNAVAGAIAGIPIAILVAAINILAFGTGADAIGFFALVAYCALIAMAVTVLFAILETTLSERGAAPAAAPAPPPILKRVPLPERGRLLALTVSDHYVEIVTDRGTALVLMRLSDAIAETNGVAGLRVHRSHWVALDAVRRVARKGGKLMLELETGAEVPVSRSYQEAAREAGLTA